MGYHLICTLFPGWGEGDDVDSDDDDDDDAGQETFFSIRLPIWTSAMCILLVRTTKLLAQNNPT